MFLGEVEENFTIYVDVYTVCIELGPRVLGHSEPRLDQYCSKIGTDLKTCVLFNFFPYLVHKSIQWLQLSSMTVNIP